MKFTDRLRSEVDQFGVKDPDHTVAADMIDELEAALRRIGAYDDELGSRALSRTGSYGSFDEPGSVKIARDALAKLEKLNRE